MAAGLALATGPRAGALVAAALVLAALAAAGAPALGALAAALVLGGTAFGELRLRCDRRERRARRGRAHGRGLGASAHAAAAVGLRQLGRGRRDGRTTGRSAAAAAGSALGATAAEACGSATSCGCAGACARRVRDERRAPNRRATPGAATGGSFDFAAYLRRRGIAGELLLDDARATGRRRGGVAHVLDLMRERAQRAVAAGLPPPEAALARGMVLGQDEAIAEGVREDFRASGLAHLLAVSGQNVMLLVALALPLLAVAGLGPRGRGVALLGLVAVYVPLAGAGPSLQRAGVMGAAGIAAMTLSRPASRWYALLLAAAATLALNPRAWEDPGWQLSFAAVVGILCLGVPLGRALTRVADGLRRCAGGVRPTRAAAAPAAYAALHGPPARSSAPRSPAASPRAPRSRSPPRWPRRRCSLTTSMRSRVAGLPANLLALPAVAPAMWLGMVKAALGLLAPLAAAARLARRGAGPARAAAGRLHRPAGRAVRPAARRPAVAAAPVARGRADRLRAPRAGGAWACTRAARALGPRAQELAARWRRRPRAQRARGWLPRWPRRSC